MQFRSWKAGLRSLLAYAGLLTACSAGLGQEVALGLRPRPSCPTSPCPSPYAPDAPATTIPETAPTTPAAPTPAVPAAEPTLTPEQFAATGGGETFAAASSAVGYIDPAIPTTRYRLRADAAWGNNRPDRAEFFYPKCGCFAIAGIDPNASGPPLTESNVDYQEIMNYVEWAPWKQFSAFIEVPMRIINPEVNANVYGFGDINTGAKYAFLYSPEQVATAQLRVYVPTGLGRQGLGTDHASIEPGLLYYRQLSKRVAMEGEFKDWAALGGSDFAGNVLRYGIGANYVVVDRCNLRVAPVAEFVGWTVLHGKESSQTGAISDAAGDTIVNAKLGVRTGFGPLNEARTMNRSDLYLGYGRALTGEVWYKDVVRLEFRLNY